LTVLQLSGSIASTKILNYFSNALISNRTLKYLDISNHGSVPGVIKLVKEILLNLHSLKGLGLANNGIEVFKVREICAILKTNTTLIELNLNSNTLGNDGVSLVAEMLNHNTTLKRISLNNNYIKDCGASILSVALGQNTTLNRIDLGSNSITNNSASEVLQSISSNSNYTSLDLSNNDIRDINPSILTSLKMTSSIIHLDLHHNRLEGKIGEIQAQILKNFQAISYFSYFLSNEFKNNQFVIELPSEFRVSQLKYFNKKLFDELHSGKYNSDNEIRNITCNGQNLPRESELDNFVQERFFNLIGV